MHRPLARRADAVDDEQVGVGLQQGGHRRGGAGVTEADRHLGEPGEVRQVLGVPGKLGEPGRREAIELGLRSGALTDVHRQHGADCTHVGLSRASSGTSMRIPSSASRPAARP